MTRYEAFEKRSMCRKLGDTSHHRNKKRITHAQSHHPPRRALRVGRDRTRNVATVADVESLRNVSGNQIAGTTMLMKKNAVSDVETQVTSPPTRRECCRQRSGKETMTLQKGFLRYLGSPHHTTPHSLTCCDEQGSPDGQGPRCLRAS